MRDYGKVYTKFWTSDDIRGMSEDGRTLALYLLTCTHSNMLGCFRLTNAYAADDLQWDSERVSKGFDELLSKGFAYRCERSFWLVIREYLKWNQFDNPNVGKAAIKVFESLSAPNDVKALLVLALREYGTHFPSEKIRKYEENLEPYRNPFDTVSKPVVVVGAVVVTTTGAEAKPIHVEQNQLDVAAEIFDYWKKVMKSPKSAFDAKRKKLIEGALKNYSPADVCKAIRGCSKSPHNMGENDRNTKFNGLNLILRDADHIDRFISLDSGDARSATESIGDSNERVLAQYLGGDTGSNVIEMVQK